MDMDHMDIDQVYDVPDTPDRLATQNVSDRSGAETDIGSSGSTCMKRFGIFYEGLHNQQRGKSKAIIEDGLKKRPSFDPVKVPIISSNSEADDAVTLPRTNSPSSKNSHLLRRTKMDGPRNYESQYYINSQRKEKGIARHPSQSSPSGENAVVDFTKKDGHSQNREMAFPKEARNSKAAPSTYKGKEKIDDTSKGSSAVKEAGIQNVPVRKMRLVRNGCISPHNIAKAKHVAANQSNSSINVRNGMGPAASNCSSDLVGEIVSEGSSYQRARRFKSQLSLPKDVDAKSLTSRQGMSSNGEANVTSTSVRDALRSFDRAGGWRNTRNSTENVDPSFIPKDKHIHQQDDRRALRSFKGSSSSNHGARSSLPSVDSDIVDLGSPCESSNLGLRRNQKARGLGTLNSIIEIEESSPDMRRADTTNRRCSSSNDDLYARAIQLEADEMLALELQEQLYNEMSQVGNGEIDANIALALQEEETSQPAFATGSLPVSRPRGRVTSNSGRRSQSRTSHNPATWTSTQAQGPARSRLTRLRSQFLSESPRLPVRRRSSLFPSNMDLDMRIHILEALEAVSDMGMGSSIFEADRDFNENDYEMLLGLDENNHQHCGASARVINRLPQSMVQNEDAEECAICLEKPSVGAAIRHLPCLHKFHKDCIDPWLRRKSSCPVCKSSVT